MKSFKFTNLDPWDTSLDDTDLNFEDLDEIGPLRFELNYGENTTIDLVSKDSPKLRYKYCSEVYSDEYDGLDRSVIGHATLNLSKIVFERVEKTKHIILNLTLELNNISEIP